MPRDRRHPNDKVALPSRPSVDEIEGAIEERRRKRRLVRAVVSTVSGLLTLAAIVVLVATFLFPSLRIYGSSMAPTLREGEVVITRKSSAYQTGEIIAFYYNNRVLVKRVVCGPGEWFNMQRDGTVFVNGSKLEEPYLDERGYGSCDLTLPYQVPDAQYFVMGDEREVSIDSRMAEVGCVPEDRIVGRIFMRVWPLDGFGLVG